MTDSVRVRLKLVGLPDLATRLGGNELSVGFGGSTVGALLQWLQKTHADPAQTRLIDRDGRLDPDVILFRNDRELIPRDALGYELMDGDHLTLVVVVAGG